MIKVIILGLPKVPTCNYVLYDDFNCFALHCSAMSMTSIDNMVRIENDLQF